jgi:hypothetical protein
MRPQDAGLCPKGWKCRRIFASWINFTGFLYQLFNQHCENSDQDRAVLPGPGRRGQTEAMVSFSNPVPTDELWDLFVRETKIAVHDFTVWVARMDDGERAIALCIFMLFMTVVMLTPNKKRQRDAGNGTGFVYAFGIILTVAFAVGWTLTGSVNVDLLMAELF